MTFATVAVFVICVFALSFFIAELVKTIKERRRDD